MKRESLQSVRRKAAETHRMIDAAVAEVQAEQHAAFDAAKAAHKKAEAERHRYTRGELVGATHILDWYGNAREVVRVNQKTVTVKTAYSWTETVPFDKVRAVKR